MPVDVVAVFNTVGEVKPLWILKNGKKSKVQKINSIISLHGINVYHCVIDGCMVSLRYDGISWWTD